MKGHQDCIFCNINAKRSPASFVYEDEVVYGIMSLDQPNPYKVLMIPRQHIENIFDMPEEIAAHLFKITVKVAKAIKKASACPGLNLVQSNGQVGQQDVFHFHLHLIPRLENDGIALNWDTAAKDRIQLEHMANEIKDCFD